MVRRMAESETKGDNMNLTRGRFEKLVIRHTSLVLAAFSACTANAVNVVGDANATTTYTPTNTIITMTQNGTLTVTEPGEIEILLVGGGGGGGRNLLNVSSTCYGGGGGGGGVIHASSFAVTKGEHSVMIGAGGDVSANGGDTEAFGLTAYGGGRGAGAGGKNFNQPASAGGSGGGGSSYDGTEATNNPGQDQSAEAMAAGNLGSSGASNLRYSGGGGGAGGAADGYRGGAGYLCDITGEGKYYAGGGNGSTWGTVYASSYGASAECHGGGGQPGGAGKEGIVVVRFTRTEAKPTSDFALSGFQTTGKLPDRYSYCAFTESGTLHVTGRGTVEMLVVGGGGSSGWKDGSYNGGGGGGGGVIHVRNLPVEADDYPIVVGAGGIYHGKNGENTTALGFTAYGGGKGAFSNAGGGAGSGGSGGGGSKSGSATFNGATQSADATAAFNLGNKGGNPESQTYAGGGGGAGTAGNGKNGGDGYLCDITGTATYYAGGGSGTGFAQQEGAGARSYGGGGSGNGTGGNGKDGVVILRWKRPETALQIIVR